MEGEEIDIHALCGSVFREAIERFLRYHTSSKKGLIEPETILLLDQYVAGNPLDVRAVWQRSQMHVH